MMNFLQSIVNQFVGDSSEIDDKIETNDRPTEKIPTFSKKEEKIICWPTDLWAELFTVIDLSNNVCKYLKASDFVNLSMANKKLHEIIDCEDSWQSLTEQHSGIYQKEDSKMTWKQFYSMLVTDRWKRTGEHFGGAWKGQYWKVHDTVYSLDEPLWWFSCGVVVPEVLPPGRYFAYWFLNNGTSVSYDYKLNLNGTDYCETITEEEFNKFTKQWVIVRVGPYEAGSGKTSSGWIENTKNTYKGGGFQVKWFKIVPVFGASIAEKNFQEQFKIKDKCWILK